MSTLFDKSVDRHASAASASSSAVVANKVAQETQSVLEFVLDLEQLDVNLFRGWYLIFEMTKKNKKNRYFLKRYRT